MIISQIQPLVHPLLLPTSPLRTYVTIDAAFLLTESSRSLLILYINPVIGQQLYTSHQKPFRFYGLCLTLCDYIVLGTQLRGRGVIW